MSLISDSFETAFRDKEARAGHSRTHRENIEDYVDESGNVTSYIKPCVRADYTFSYRALVENMGTCMEQLITREKNRRYWVYERKTKYVLMDINRNWSQCVKDIFRYIYTDIHGNESVLVQVGPHDDLNHNVNGFLTAIDLYERNLKWFYFPWRLLRQPSTQTEQERAKALGRTERIASVFNLIFVQKFKHEQDAQMYANQRNEQYYLFNYDTYIRPL